MMAQAVKCIRHLGLKKRRVVSNIQGIYHDFCHIQNPSLCCLLFWFCFSFLIVTPLISYACYRWTVHCILNLKRKKSRTDHVKNVERNQFHTHLLTSLISFSSTLFHIHLNVCGSPILCNVSTAQRCSPTKTTNATFAIQTTSIDIHPWTRYCVQYSHGRQFPFVTLPALFAVPACLTCVQVTWSRTICSKPTVSSIVCICLASFDLDTKLSPQYEHNLSKTIVQY